MIEKEYSYFLPIGPQHPALKESMHLTFKMEAEEIKDMDFNVGYVHRGIEGGMMTRSYDKSLYLAQRICGICNQIHASAYCLAVERLVPTFQVPKRAEYIRTVLNELERIHSHMLFVGVAAHEFGFDTVFMYTWRDRELIMQLKEKITGNRVTNDMNCVGGMRRDIPKELEKELEDAVEYFSERADYYVRVFTKDISVQKRTKGIGVLSKKDARRLNAVGPTARSSGIDYDIRSADPYEVYKYIKFKPVILEDGDVFARVASRILEVKQACDVIRQCLPLPEGKLKEVFPRNVPPAEAVASVEAPRGELFYYAKSNGTNIPERIKVRTPTYANFLALKQFTVGYKLADIPLLVASIDPCLSCTDRVTVVDEKSTRVLTHADLQDIAKEEYR
ncbi:MAG: nickel-dependent hydrogenase large subunit [archaeon]